MLSLAFKFPLYLHMKLKSIRVVSNLSSYPCKNAIVDIFQAFERFF